MSYTTIENLTNAFTEVLIAQLSNDSDPTKVDDSIVEDIINNVSSQMNDYLRGKYSLPLTNTHPILVDICNSIVFYELHKRRGLQEMENVYNLQKLALTNLTSIQKGIAILDEPIAGIKPFPIKSNKDTARIFTTDFYNGLNNILR